MTKTFKGLIIVVMLMFVFNFAAALPVGAIEAEDLGISYAEETDLSSTDPRTMASSLIKVILGFLGILAVIIILIGGFKWMTAAGNDEQIDEARKIIIAGIIGLVIILAAWGIANFVLTSVLSALEG